MSLKEEELTTNVTFALSREGSLVLGSLKEFGISERAIAIGVEYSLLSILSELLESLNIEFTELSGTPGLENLEDLLKLLSERKLVGEPS